MWVYKATEPRARSGLTIPIGNVSSVFSRPGLWGDSRPVIIPPTITYDRGLHSLPEDIICEISNLLDMEALKSLSLTCKALSRSAKPFIHRTLYLTSRSGDSTSSNVPGCWNELEGLPILGKRGLLQHTRHLSIILPHDPLSARDLEPNIQHHPAPQKLRNRKTRWLDTPLFILKVEEYSGAFWETLRSMELEFPRGDRKQIFYFICQFPNLRDLKIISVKGLTNSVRNAGPRPISRLLHLSTVPSTSNLVCARDSKTIRLVPNSSSIIL